MRRLRSFPFATSVDDVKSEFLSVHVYFPILQRCFRYLCEVSENHLYTLQSYSCEALQLNKVQIVSIVRLKIYYLNTEHDFYLNR